MTEPIQEKRIEFTPEGYVSKRQLATLLNCSVRSVTEWMNAGRIPYYKFGKRVAFKWSEVDAHMRATCRVSRSLR